MNRATIKYISSDKKRNIFTNSEDSSFANWRIIKPKKDEIYIKIRSISNALYLTSDDFGKLTVQPDSETDFQLWLINKENGLIKNKKTEMYLTTDFEGNINTLEDLKTDFNKWKLLLPNETFSVPSRIIDTPFGPMDLTENTNPSNLFLHR